MKIFDSFIDGGEKYYVEFDEIAQIVEAVLAEDYQSLSAKEKAKYSKGIKSMDEFIKVKSRIEFAVVAYGQDLLEHLRERFSVGDIQPTAELVGAVQSLEAWYSVVPMTYEGFVDQLVTAPRELGDNFKAMKESLRQSMRAAIDQLPYLIMPEAYNIQKLKKAMKALKKKQKF